MSLTIIHPAVPTEHSAISVSIAEQLSRKRSVALYSDTLTNATLIPHLRWVSAISPIRLRLIHVNTIEPVPILQTADVFVMDLPCAADNGAFDLFILESVYAGKDVILISNNLVQTSSALYRKVDLVVADVELHSLLANSFEEWFPIRADNNV